MKETLAIVGVGALLAWTGLGLVAWSSAARRVTVDFADEQSQAREGAELLALRDELGALHQDVRALAAAMAENLQVLSDGLVASQDEREAAVEHRLVAPAPSPTDTTASDRAAAEDAKPRRSFLAFKLPSDDLAFDERRAWSILPALSRVGFDAQTTLHDFTATTSELEGELEADLSHPEAAPRARILVQAARLASGDSERDEAMREHLGVAQHAAITFELTRFESAEVDLAAMHATGQAYGRMTVRGVTQEVVMSVRLAIDEARRLCVEGEMMLDLTRFQVPVPNKLGLISMEKEVKVWISLRLRASSRSEG